MSVPTPMTTKRSGHRVTDNILVLCRHGFCRGPCAKHMLLTFSRDPATAILFQSLRPCHTPWMSSIAGLSLASARGGPHTQHHADHHHVQRSPDAGLPAVAHRQHHLAPDGRATYPQLGGRPRREGWPAPNRARNLNSRGPDPSASRSRNMS